MTDKKYEAFMRTLVRINNENGHPIPMRDMDTGKLIDQSKYLPKKRGHRQSVSPIRRMWEASRHTTKASA